jgi:CubicO group peptidase (beta-lactamase class C family)
MDFSDVDAHIDTYVNKNNLDGASLVVTDSGGNIIYQKNYGANFDEYTVVPIASATKWLTGATVMTLVEDGLIQSLDDPVSKYLPYFVDKGAKSEITIRQMLAFTSGLPGHTEAQDDPHITQQDECAFVAENVELLRDPGTGFEYGGLQMEIAACVAEVVTGQPYREIMQERLLDPLGMTDTQLANLVNRNPRNPDYTSANPLTPGGVYSNASDLIKFSQMILAGGSYNGNQVLSPETVQAMTADQTFGVPLNKTIWPGEAKNQWRYGLGNWVQVLDPIDNSPEEEARRLVSSEGVFGTSEWVDFDLQYAAAFTIWATKSLETVTFVNDLKNLVSEAVASGSSQSEAPSNQEDYAVSEIIIHSLELDIAANIGVDSSWK